MNLRRGFFRIWIALSVLWVALSTWLIWESCVRDSDGYLWCSVLDGDWIMELRYFGWRDGLRIATAVLSVPVGLLIIGATSFWVKRGFSNSN
jgi:hypothetical protein